MTVGVPVVVVVVVRIAEEPCDLGERQAVCLRKAEADEQAGDKAGARVQEEEVRRPCIKGKKDRLKFASSKCNLFTVYPSVLGG